MTQKRDTFIKFIILRFLMPSASIATKVNKQILSSGIMDVNDNFFFLVVISLLYTTSEPFIAVNLKGHL
jgi:hypothetical protein